MAAGREFNFRMTAAIFDAARVENNYATQASAELRGNTGGDYAERLKFAGVECRSERDRAIIVKRHAVDNVLRVVFRAARVQYAVRFNKPPRHGRYHIDRTSS